MVLEVFLMDIYLFFLPTTVSFSLPFFFTVLAAYFVALKNPLELVLVSEPESSSLILKFLSPKDFL